MELNKRSISELSFQLHKNINNHFIINSIIEKFKLEDLIKVRNNGIISNLLNYYIITKNDSKINEILLLTQQLNDFELMKRDYLNLIQYYYYSDLPKALNIFNNILNNTYFLQKDIDFIIQNNFTKLLEKLDGLFIDTTIDNNTDVNYNNLKLYYIKNNIFKTIFYNLELKLSNDIKNHLNSFYSVIIIIILLLMLVMYYTILMVLYHLKLSII